HGSSGASHGHGAAGETRVSKTDLVWHGLSVPDGVRLHQGAFGVRVWRGGARRYLPRKCFAFDATARVEGRSYFASHDVFENTEIRSKVLTAPVSPRLITCTSS